MQIRTTPATLVIIVNNEPALTLDYSGLAGEFTRAEWRSDIEHELNRAGIAYDQGDISYILTMLSNITNTAFYATK